MAEVEELWKRIPDFPNYEASSLGRIRGKRGIVKKSKPHGWGEVFHILSYCGEKYKVLTSHIIANLFVPNNNEWKYASTISDDFSDIRACNIEWTLVSTPYPIWNNNTHQWMIGDRVFNPPVPL